MAVKKKAAVKKAAAAPKKPATKTEIIANLSEATGLAKKDVNAVFVAMAEMINKEINPRRRGPGVFNIPGLMKIKVVKKPATKARKGTNPFTGEEMMFKAKPARNVVKVLPLKGLKEMV